MSRPGNTSVQSSLEGLQAQLNKLKEYADLWDLKISFEKTKVMLMSGDIPAGDLATRPPLLLNGQALEWVREFVYLGSTFHESATMEEIMAAGRLLKARFAQAAVRQQCSAHGLSTPAMQMRLFDIIVRSTLGYGIELWGPGYLLTPAATKNNDDVEELHRGYLRRLLGVRETTPSLACYAEFGRYPLQGFWKRCIFGCWKRLMDIAISGERPLLAAAVRDNMALAAQQHAAGAATKNLAWAGKVAAVLQSVGIEIDLNAGPAPIARTTAEVTKILKQQYLETLKSADGSKVSTYKEDIMGWQPDEEISISAYRMQHYLEVPMPRKQRCDLARFRTSSHSLRVETDRYHRHPVPPRESRTCRLCGSGHVEDEHHMVFNCSHQPFEDLRQNFFQLFEGSSSCSKLSSFLLQHPRQVAAYISRCFDLGDYAAFPKPTYVPQPPRVGTRTSPRLAERDSSS